ncbi:MAG: DUF4270 domain-containing protein [Bacteroidales bacterium]
MKINTNPRLYGVFYSLLKRIALLIVVLLMAIACEESDQVGLELIQSPVEMNTTDTLTIQAVTARDDSVATNLSGRNILGVLNDPEFGKTRAGIYTETRLPFNDLSLGENPRLDSVHLVMNYTGEYYGNVEVFHQLQVYELSENFPARDTLFSNLEIPHDPEPLTKDPEGFRLRPAPTDSVMVDTVLRPPHIRIPLSDAYGQKLIDANGTQAFENVPDFVDAFKGLYITIDEDTEDMGALYAMDMLAPMTSIQLYYHNDDDTLQQMTQFPINEFARRATKIDHYGFEGANESLQAQVEHEEFAEGDSLLFVQSLGVTRAHVYMPYLDDLKDLQGVVINKAELLVPVQEGFATDDLPETEDMLLLRFREDGNLSFISDYHVGSSYFGGELDKENMEYRFNISQYVQDLMNGVYENRGLTIVASDVSEGASRVVLRGPGRQENPMRMVIYYTVFNK